MANSLDYGWLVDDSSSSLGEAACLTVVVGKRSDAVLQDFGADGAERVALSDVWAGDRRSTVSIVDAVGGVVAVEINGFQGSREEVLRPASEGGVAASVYWGVNGNTRFACARKGRMLCDLDLLYDDDPAGLPASLRRLLPADPLEADLEAVGASMVEAFTGVQVTQQMIASLDDAFRLRPVFGQLHPETPGLTTLQYEYPELVEQLVAADDARCRQIAQWAALRSVEQVGLQDDSRVQSITVQFGAGAAALETLELVELVLQFDRAADDAAVADDAQGPTSRHRELCWQRQWAAKALRHNCVEVAVSAALGAVESAIYCFGIDGAEAAFLEDFERRI